MEFIIGCSNTDSQEDPTGPIIVEEEYRSQFVFDDLTRISRKVLRLSQDYNIVTNQDIFFHVQVKVILKFSIKIKPSFHQACLPEDTSACKNVTVTVNYPFNSNRPQFNDISGEAKILDAEACSEQDSQMDEACQVDFSKPFFASDSDGDVVNYEIIPPSHIFGIGNSTDLATLYYKGTGISQETSIPLLIQVRQTGPSAATSPVVAQSVS